jgi:hypothetical protein
MKLVEVFVEKDCPSCEEVMTVVGPLSRDRSIELRVYDRERHRDAFRERRVVICPATFVDQRLVFYGAFTLAEVARFIM